MHVSDLDAAEDWRTWCCIECLHVGETESFYWRLHRAMHGVVARGLRNPQQAGGFQFMTLQELIRYAHVISETARRRGQHIRILTLRRRKESEQEERDGVISRGNVQVGGCGIVFIPRHSVVRMSIACRHALTCHD